MKLNCVFCWKLWIFFLSIFCTILFTKNLSCVWSPSFRSPTKNISEIFEASAEIIIINLLLFTWKNILHMYLTSNSDLWDNNLCTVYNSELFGSSWFLILKQSCYLQRKADSGLLKNKFIQYSAHSWNVLNLIYFCLWIVVTWLHITKADAYICSRGLHEGIQQENIDRKTIDQLLFHCEFCPIYRETWTI